ncbi:ribokinase [Motilibacter rhizosphaerae]|uniref:Ribokinase n=1 Tax=Motilibacter rhizosphaerae TaxID=598652 RepID=A0A4Q7NYK4_9ACTN|nr:ribokinase [Motilibacter rhizosphaerae]RZS91482.1 ribokinase [Motilibacter rhizosphaerae]
MSNDLPAATTGGGVVGVVVVGSANVDLLVTVPRIPRPGETVLGGDLRRAAGGKGANQAVAAARLGARTTFVGRVGDDEPGAGTQRALAAEGIDCRWLRSTPGTATGTALIAVDSTGENTIVVSPGANARLQPADVEAAAEAVGPGAVLVTQLETGVAGTCAALAAARGARFLLNAAPAPSSLAADVVAAADPLVVNEHEAAAVLEVLGARTWSEPRDHALALAQHAASVVVTAGADGAWWCLRGEQAQHVPAPPVGEVVDTTGAGDTVVGAVAAALAAGSGLAEAVERGVRAASWSVRVAGAQPSMPRSEDLAATRSTRRVIPALGNMRDTTGPYGTPAGAPTRSAGGLLSGPHEGPPTDGEGTRAWHGSCS